MMKALKTILLWGLAAGITACQEDFLEKTPPNNPSSATFLSTRAEVEVAVNNAYRTFYWLANNMPLRMFTDHATDLGWIRANNYGSALQAVAQGNASPTTSVFNSAWEHHYNYIARVNYILENLDRARENGVDEVFLSEAAAQIRFLRAYCYSNLTEYFGDVPLVTSSLSIEEAKEKERTPKPEVVSAIMEDLDFAAAGLPEAWGSNGTGRATKGAALTLKARVALYNGQYETAAQAAGAVMDMNKYELYNNYEELFQYAGEGSSEVILDMDWHADVQLSGVPLMVFPRGAGGWSIMVPSQFLVDSYEGIDGRPIDESTDYDPARPFENRDPRLAASIIYPGSWWGGFLFETHPDSVETWKADGGDTIRIDNQEVLNAFATFTGYLWRKYNCPEDIGAVRESTLNFMLMRYAEVLLTYAEAKIELGEIDNSVLEAINQVRARAYGVSPSAVSEYPAVAVSDPAALREIIRRERKIELAGEGFRLSDIRRWGIAEHVLHGKFPGRKKKERWYSQGIPDINAYGHPVYSDFDAVFSTLETRVFRADRDYLWPVPQSEMNLYQDKWQQNPGW